MVRVAILIFSTLASSCGGSIVPAPPPEVRVTVADAASPIAQRAKVPVLYPPEVLAVYVFGHTDAERDIFIGEHWVFVRVSDAKWFPEKHEQLRYESAAEQAPVEKLRKFQGAFDRETLEKAVFPIKKQ